MKKTYGYIPLWFLLILPPLVVLTLACNFLFAGVALISGAIILKIKDPFNDYYKRILRLFLLTIEVDIFCALCYGLPEFLNKIEFLNKNLITPLEYNPYKKILSFIYISLVFILITKFIYKKINKKILKEFEDNDNKIRAGIIMTMFLIPYIFFVPSEMIVKRNKSNLDDFRGTVMTDKTSIVQLLANLNISKYISSYSLETNVQPYTLHIYLDNITKDSKKKMEIDAATIFLLIKDVNEIKFYMNESTYTYDINRINEIFGNIKRKSLQDINIRYSTKQFKNNTYLGRINGHDVFDIGNSKKNNKLLYDDNGVHYYLNVTNINQVYLYDKEKQLGKLKDEIINKKITVTDLKESELEIILTGNEVNDEDNN